jgi:hypothetical protein
MPLGVGAFLSLRGAMRISRVQLLGSPFPYLTGFRIAHTGGGGGTSPEPAGGIRELIPPGIGASK